MMPTPEGLESVNDAYARILALLENFDPNDKELETYTIVTGRGQGFAEWLMDKSDLTVFWHGKQRCIITVMGSGTGHVRFGVIDLPSAVLNYLGF
jgi:hypothetical protein